MPLLQAEALVMPAHLVLELLTELQGDGEEHQRVAEPRHHTLHLVNVAHLEAVVVELAVEDSANETHNLTAADILG